MAAQAKPGVQERILLHLLDYSDFKDSIEVPFALSQMGIANAVTLANQGGSYLALGIPFCVHNIHTCEFVALGFVG